MKKFILSLALVAIAMPAFGAVGEINIEQGIGQTGRRKVQILPQPYTGFVFDRNKKAIAAAVPISYKYSVTAAQIAAISGTTAGDFTLDTFPAKSVIMTATVKHSTALLANALSTQTLTSDNTNVANTETVVIGSKTYTFKTALTPTEGEVLIGGSADASLLNLIRAINHTGTAGTDYQAAAANTQVTAAASVTSHAFAVTAVAVGVAGQVATTETSAHLSWGAATTTGGQLLSAATARIITSDHNFGSGATDVFTAVTNSALTFDGTPFSVQFGTTTPVLLHVTTTGANLSAVTTGGIDCWITVLVRP